MPFYTIQPSFSGGEFSPSLYSRIDIQKYSTALKTARNFIIHPHGGASNRGGMQFIKRVKSPTKKTRVIPFEFSLDQKYILEFGENYVRFIKDDGYVLTGGGAIYEVVTTYAENDIGKIKFFQSADVLFLLHPNYKPKRLTRFSDNNWTFDNFPFVLGPFLSEKKIQSIAYTNITTVPVTGIMFEGYQLKVTSPGYSFFQAGHAGALLKISQHLQSQSHSQTITGNVSIPSADDQLPMKGTWRFATRGTWAGQISLLRNAPNSYVGWEVIQTFTHNSSDFNIDATGVQDELAKFAIGMDLWGGGTCYADLSCDSFDLETVLSIDVVNSDTEVTVTTKTPGLYYETIQSWQEGSWSDLRGYPSCGGFYQDRFVAAATPVESQAVWTSKTGNYYDFGTSSPLEDTDAVSVNLPSRKMNAIKSILTLSEILAMTSASECGVGETGGVFSPTTVKTRVHSYRGTSEAEPAIVGNRAIVVQAMGSVVRDFGYDFQVDGYTGSDLSIFSSHLFKGFNIVEMAYQQEPDSLVWMVRSDGKLLSMTYMKEQDVVAWTWHETDGLVESICSIPGDGQNDVYMVVNRDGNRNIEKIGKRLPSSDCKDARFLDSFLTYEGSATTTITGLTHLEGKTVSALADGNVVKNLVVTSGSITLPVASTKVHIGLPYVSDIQTLKIQVPVQDGSSYGRLVKVSAARLTFLDSRGGYIGPDDTSLDEIIALSGAALGSPSALFTGDYKQALASGYDSGGTVFFRQSDPLPVTILSIEPTITVGG